MVCLEYKRRWKASEVKRNVHAGSTLQRLMVIHRAWKNKQKGERGGEGSEPSPEGLISWGLQQHAGFQYTLPFDVPVIKEKKCQLSQKVITLICTTCKAENCTRTIYTHTFTPQQAFFPSLSKILPSTPGTGSYASTFHPFLHFLISIFLHHWWST